LCASSHDTRILLTRYPHAEISLGTNDYTAVIRSEIIIIIIIITLTPIELTAHEGSVCNLICTGETLRGRKPVGPCQSVVARFARYTVYRSEIIFLLEPLPIRMRSP
jgi:hypothetical protein